jgi:hypothetical protein
MGFVQFCLASFFFFMTPSVILLYSADRRGLMFVTLAACAVAIGYAMWLFPQLSRESLAFSSLLFDLYCYLVLLIGITVGATLKAIELKFIVFIPLLFILLLIVNLTAMIASEKYWFLLVI